VKRTCVREVPFLWWIAIELVGARNKRRDTESAVRSRPCFDPELVRRLKDGVNTRPWNGGATIVKNEA
jgi:hypothetical protein